MRVNANSKGGNGDWSPRLLSEGKGQHGSRPHPVSTTSEQGEGSAEPEQS